MEKNVLFIDVDTQFDFMDPTGRLYVRGAEAIVPAVGRIRRFAGEQGCCLAATADWHTAEDAEIAAEPDFEQTYPPHCMAHSPGAVRVGDLGPVPIETLDLRRFDPAKLRSILAKKPFHLELRKNCVDVFSYPEMNALLDRISPQIIIVFGVALDVCVFHTVRGLLNRKRETVYLLSDAVKGLGQQPDAEILGRLERMGARITSFEPLKKDLFHAVS